MGPRDEATLGEEVGSAFEEGNGSKAEEEALVVVSFDPGRTTGYAVWNYPKGSFSAGQAAWDDAADWSYAFAAGCHDSGIDLQLVSESFVITAATLRKSRESASLEFIGLLRWLAHRYTRHELVLQTPANAKSFSTDDKLQKLGWRQPGKVHANDAARHMLIYLVDAGLFAPRLLV